VPNYERGRYQCRRIHHQLETATSRGRKHNRHYQACQCGGWIEEESPCGREEEVAELVDEHPDPVRPVGAGTSAIMVEVSDPEDLLLMLSTPLHFAAVATDVKLADNAYEWLVQSYQLVRPDEPYNRE